MTADGPVPVPTMAKAVLAHFVRNPQAAEDLENVARWRVQQEAIAYTVEQVDRALRWLVAREFLVQEGRPGVGPLFRLNRTKLADAERFLSQERAPAPPVLTNLMRQALGWVDAALLRYHCLNPPSGGDLPGLTRSHATVDRALGSQVLVPDTDADDSRRVVDETARDLVAALDHADTSDPLAALYRGLELTPLEIKAVLLCLAPEVDAKYQAVYGILNDDLGRRAMTLGLLCTVLGDPLAVRSALTGADGLTAWRLFESGAMLPHADEPLRLDAVIVAWLLGNAEALVGDPRLSHVAAPRRSTSDRWLSHPADAGLIERLARGLAGEAREGWLVLSGEDTDAWHALVDAAARDAGRPLVRAGLGALASGDPADVGEITVRLARVVRLSGTAPVVDAADLKPDGSEVPVLARLVAALTDAGRPGVLIVPDVHRVIAALPRDGGEMLYRDAPDPAARATAFASVAADGGLSVGADDAARLAMAFPLSLGRFTDAVRLATLSGAAEEPPERHAHALTTACRRVASPDLPRFAQRVVPIFQLSDVVLPADRHTQLREMVAHVRHAGHVLHRWGFDAQLPYGRGVGALFWGPSGTGKTMAAQAIARALTTEMYVVDLSHVVSKYIGETEKSLDVVFNDAERAGAVLLFDEADALFGKRSEIKDAHDRYANIEVAYLLQRMESFGGLAILTTNFRRNLDDAFLRRLRFVVEFPKPDEAAREAIWRQCLPETAPTGEDLDIPFLARHLDVSGGNIRQITLRAAFAAVAEEAERIEMRHVVAATRAELLKLGMRGAERELAEFLAARRRAAARVA